MGEEWDKGGSVQVGIVVRDLAAMTAFYEHALGLLRIEDVQIPGGTMKRYRCGDGCVKLVRFDSGLDGAGPPNGMLGGVSGMRYFTLDVGDVAGTVARCEAAGHKVAIPIMEFMPGMPIAIVEDPDGNWVELMQ
jgi:catechol 2,3-dioxygenase-like lactoylglutathione lyase family enzyme